MREVGGGGGSWWRRVVRASGTARNPNPCCTRHAGRRLCTVPPHTHTPPRSRLRLRTGGIDAMPPLPALLCAWPSPGALAVASLPRPWTWTALQPPSASTCPAPAPAPGPPAGLSPPISLHVPLPLLFSHGLPSPLPTSLHLPLLLPLCLPLPLACPLACPSPPRTLTHTSLHLPLAPAPALMPAPARWPAPVRWPAPAPHTPASTWATCWASWCWPGSKGGAGRMRGGGLAWCLTGGAGWPGSNGVVGNWPLAACLAGWQGDGSRWVGGGGGEGGG